MRKQQNLNLKMESMCLIGFPFTQVICSKIFIEFKKINIELLC